MFCGYCQVKDPSSGDFYYFNEKTGVTQWEAPAASAAPVAKGKAVPSSTQPASGTKFDVKEFERTGRIVPLENQGKLCCIHALQDMMTSKILSYLYYVPITCVTIPDETLFRRRDSVR